MIKLLLWIAWLLVLFAIAVKLSRKNLFTPQIGFLAGFIFQALYAIFYVDCWQLDFSEMTMLILFCGSGTFLLASLVMQCLYEKYSITLLPHPRIPQSEANSVKSTCGTIDARWKLLLFLGFQVGVLVWLSYFVIGYSGGAGLSEAIKVFKEAQRSAREVTAMGMPVLLKLTESFCEAVVYVWSYIFILRVIYKEKTHKWLLILNYLAGLSAGTIMHGGRGNFVNPLVGAVVQAYFIYGSYKKWDFKIPYKIIGIFASTAAFIVVTFQRSQLLLGRSTAHIPWADYLAVYFAAELKNLDIFVRGGVLSADITTCYTLADTIRFIGELFNIPSWVHYWNNPFRSINGFFLGNVATTFYAPAHDGGVWAVIFFMAIMAIICQIAFQKARRIRQSDGIRFDILFYSHVYVQILFSFFSMKFYEQVICPTMIKILLSWWITVFVLERVRFGIQCKLTKCRLLQRKDL